MSKQRDHKRDDRRDNATDRPLGTVTGESLGSGTETPTNIGRDGDVLVQDELLFGRSESGLRRRERGPSASPDEHDTPDRSDEG